VSSAVKSADFSLHKGRTLGVVGESGSGKTTIGMMLTRLTDATAGSIMFEGIEPRPPERGADARPTAAASRSFSRTPTPA
jgi:ABC-type oligopeptide transport system ATPase subunit